LRTERVQERPVRSIDRWLNARSDAAVTATAAALLVAAGMVAFASFQHYSAAVEDQARRAMRARAESRRSDVEGVLRAREADAKVLAARLESMPAHRAGTPGFLEPDAAPMIDRIFRDTAGPYHYRDIRLLDANARVVRALTGDNEEPVESRAFRDALASGRPAFVDVHPSGGGQRAFGWVQPLFPVGAATAAGLVFIEINVAESLTPIAVGGLGGTGTEEAALVRTGDHDLDYITPRRLVARRADASERPTGRTLAAQVIGITGTTAIEGIDYRHEYVVGAATPVTGTGWYVIVKADAAEIQAPVTAIRLAILSIMGVLMTFLVVGARLIWRARQADLLQTRITADKRYRAAINASIDGYIVADDAGAILEANDALLRMLGYTREAFVGRRMADVQARTSVDECDDQIRAFKVAGEVRLQTRWHRADGGVADLAISLIYVAAAGGGTFHGFVHDIGPELTARRRIERLNAFYLFLSHANAAIFNLREPQEILDAICHTAVRDGGFALVWAGFVEAGAASIRPASAYGDAAAYVQTLQITIDPVLPTSRGPTRECLIQKRIVSVGDFQSDPSTALWHEKGRRYGIHASAAVPILVDGEAIAALTFYARERDYFDAELRGLLEETARNVSLALQAAHAERDRVQAETARRESEERFMRVFESSPLPMHIWSLQDRTLRAVNRAHYTLFGYTPEEISDQERWITSMYPDSVYCETVRARFGQDIDRAIRGGPGAVVESPELSVHCKDGKTRITRAYMSIVGSDILIQWLDLTEIKRQQADLIEGERRFRGMIEQTLSGVYVAAAGRIVYANPRLESILGYTRSELIGIAPFALVNPSHRDEAIRLSRRLHEGPGGVSGSLEALRKDGSQIVVGLHATQGTWDGAPADIVMVQDATESKRSEARIAAYVERLENTMRGTLQAVANMVDLRDPYTSGHERRVGIIAADIARELGWLPEACEHLRLAGLVHDIGKIAVPAEILAKPAKLTPLEYSLIKSHAEKGYEILKDVDFPIPIAEIIRQHHERLDGSGYPLGLKGDEIRIEARIIAVADVLEAMGSHRPYRPSLGIDAALAEIEAHRGSWFDAEVVDAAIRLVREKGYALPA
jgi:PAS domain S-box-containing protein/putative nucleotidyltransferase with HDIG domain